MGSSRLFRMTLVVAGLCALGDAPLTVAAGGAPGAALIDIVRGSHNANKISFLDEPTMSTWLLDQPRLVSRPMPLGVGESPVTFTALPRIPEGLSVSTSGVP